MNHITCGTYRVPAIRAELQAAYDAMNATSHHFAFAVCRTPDGRAWEVNIRTGNIDNALEGRSFGYDGYGRLTRRRLESGSAVRHRHSVLAYIDHGPLEDIAFGEFWILPEIREISVANRCSARSQGCARCRSGREILANPRY